MVDMFYDTRVYNRLASLFLLHTCTLLACIHVGMQISLIRFHARENHRAPCHAGKNSGTLSMDT